MHGAGGNAAALFPVASSVAPQADLSAVDLPLYGDTGDTTDMHLLEECGHLPLEEPGLTMLERLTHDVIESVASR